MTKEGFWGNLWDALRKVMQQKVELKSVNSTFDLCTCLPVYFFLRLILPILYIPSHAAPCADGVPLQLGTEPIPILEEINVILNSIFLNQFSKLAISVAPRGLIERASCGIDRFIRFRILLRHHSCTGAQITFIPAVGKWTCGRLLFSLLGVARCPSMMGEYSRVVNNDIGRWHDSLL